MAQVKFVDLGLAPDSNELMPRGISSDGSTVVGGHLIKGQGYAFRWTSPGGIETLPKLSSYSAGAYASSADGSIVVGWMSFKTVGKACRWTAAGIEELGYLPGSNSFAVAKDTSADGSVVIGSIEYPGGEFRAFRWTARNGMEKLPDDPDWGQMYADGVSADGMMIAGIGQFQNGLYFRGFRWSAAEGYLPLDPVLGGLGHYCEGISGDGAAICGWTSSTQNELLHIPFRWTRSRGSQRLTEDPDVIVWACRAINSDGFAVGGALEIVDGLERAFLWTPVLGLVDLNTYLPTLGVDLTGWTLIETMGLSADGSAMTGYGKYNGQIRGWVVTGMPRQVCKVDCDQDKELDVEDFVCFQTLFALGEVQADCDESGGLDIEDFICFQTAFAVGC